MGRVRILLAALAAAGLAACGEAPAPKPAAKGEGFKTAAVELREVELTTTAEAVMEAVRQSTVSAQISGRIVDLRFDVGDYVKKGEVILRIDERSATRALEASEAQVLEAQAALANARAQFERSKQLLAQKFISQAALDQAEAAYKAAQARVAALVAGAGQAATERSFATVVAPYSGVVSVRHVELGEMATPGRPLMTGFDPSTLRVVATVPQAQVAAIQALGKAPRLLVPRAAVLRRSEVTAVYVVNEQGRARLRQVRLGTAGDEASVEVLAGLKPGERVALEPVKAGMTLPGA